MCFLYVNIAFIFVFCAYVCYMFRITTEFSHLLHKLLSRRSQQQRERLSVSMLSICLYVCLFVCLSVAKMQKKWFSQKLYSLELWSLLVTYVKSYMRFSKNPLLDPEIQDGGDPPSWKSTRRHLFAEDGPIWIKISRTGAEWHVDCGDMVKIETRCRIPIWQTFERIPWHVIPESPATLQGTATWRIHCHDLKATCHIPGWIQ